MAEVKFSPHFLYAAKKTNNEKITSINPGFRGCKVSVIFCIFISKSGNYLIISGVCLLMPICDNIVLLLVLLS